jgi:molybdenum cofactor cytidylyltransferase
MIAAVVPAAGRSVRMGRPKLLLKLHGEPVIARVVRSLREGGAQRVIVVAPPEDSPEGPEIASESARAGADVIIPPARPATMRDSIELGLAALARYGRIERVLLTPGDTPGMTADLVRRLLQHAAGSPESIIVPRFESRRGHPIVVPWDIAASVPTLPEGLGVNALADRHPDRLVELPVSKANLVADLDTPDDLLHWNVGPQQDDRSAENIGTGADADGRDSLRVEIRLFAMARERAGRSLIDLELAPGSRVADLRDALREQFPELAPLLPNALIAINQEYAGDEMQILPGSRIAVIPPVSGGECRCGDPPPERRLRSRKPHRTGAGSHWQSAPTW